MESPQPDSHSREATPSSVTTSTHSTSNELASISGSSQGQSAQSQEDVERFLKRMEMERKMQVLQQRLELASMKASNGWSDMSIAEIEQTLPPPRRQSRAEGLPPIRVDPYNQLHPATYRQPHSPLSQSHFQPSSPIASSSRQPINSAGHYEPPSPSRPWQLIDVLWQPLPPPSKGMPPASPRKKSRTESMVKPEGYASLNGHRRASSVASMAHLQDRVKKDRRSYSHSTTTQDVDAAKALAFMHGDKYPRASAIMSTPTSPDLNTRPRAHSSVTSPEDLRTPRSRSRVKHRLDGETDPEDAVGDQDRDRDAAEVMMLMAHSPSPMRRTAHSPIRASPGTARVLFGGDGAAERPGKSNLAMAPPIIARHRETEFGDFLPPR